MWTPEDCLRRAALADMYASRVDFQIARQRLHEIADWWRSQVDDLAAAKADEDPDIYDGRFN
jgi:hypothetical protein